MKTILMATLAVLVAVAFAARIRGHAAPEMSPKPAVARAVPARHPVARSVPVSARKRPFTTSYISPRIRHDGNENPALIPLFQQAQPVR